MISILRRRWKLLLVASLLSVAGLFTWRWWVIERQQDRSLQSARSALARGDAKTAYALCLEWKPKARGEERAAGWLACEVSALARMAALGHLLRLDAKSPSAVADNEEASLLVARTLIHSRKPDRALDLMEAWGKRSVQPEAWMALKADERLLAGDSEGARKILEAQVFPPARDNGRLCRLAALEFSTNPASAWRLLTEAYRHNPRHAETRLFRGQFLEGLGKVPEARIEYIAARAAAPSDPYLLEQLAEFYRRQGNIALALETWRSGLTPGCPDGLWFKTAFWTRVALPQQVDWTGLEDSSGPLLPLARLIALAPQDVFLEVASGPGEADLPDREELYWLRLLSSLDAPESALNQLVRRGFRSSLNPALEVTLARILIYRTTGSLHSEIISLPRLPANAPAFFLELQTLSDRRMPIPSDTAEFLSGSRALPAVVALSGWMEAGLRLTLPAKSIRSPSAIPLAGTSDPSSGRDYLNPSAVEVSPSPPWVPYTMAQAIRYTRGPKAALAFLSRAPSEPFADLLRGELELAVSNPAGAERLWSPLLNRTDAIGDRASWLLANLRLDQRRFDEVASTLGSRASTVSGRELIARAELAAGRKDKAAQHYAALENESAEARVFLAREALAKGDTATARRLSLENAAEFPDIPQVRSNLRALDVREKKTAP